MGTAIESLLLFITIGITWTLMAEGFFGATLMAFNVLFAGLIAFSCYEPLAKYLVEQAPDYAGFFDLISLCGIFLVTLVAFRIITGLIAKREVRFPPLLNHLGRVNMGALGATMTMGFLLCALATAPATKLLFGSIDAEDKPPMGSSFNHRWLNLVRASTGKAFARYEPNPREFDPSGTWLMEHQMARPYGAAQKEISAPRAAAPPGAPGASAIPVPGK